MGRPTLYKPEYCEEVLKFMSEGGSVKEFAAHIGVSRKTVYLWIDANPEFAEAQKEAEQASEAWWMHYGRLGTFGMLPGGAKLNATAYIYNMKCRFKGQWLEDGTTNNKLEITKHTNMTEKELDRLIGAKLNQNIINITPQQLQLEQGMRDAAEGKLVDKGSFVQFANEEIE